MHDKTTAADKIRPFLKAMERSIDTARSNRVVSGRPAPVSAPTPTPPPRAADVADPVRLKARPKRSFMTP